MIIMIVDKDKIEDRYARLMSAFADKEFQDEMEKVNEELKRIITDWVNSIDRIDPRIGNVFSIQSRVKDKHTFGEKLFRKNYIQDWNVYDDIVKNQQFIKLHLTDLIGVRVNCYFAHNESRIYEELQSMQDLIPQCKLNFKENTTQSNGHKIYKFSGIYSDNYCFEVQIKSVVHNVWGEVEHKTVYKNPSFDGYIKKKREISNALYDVLLASDKELFSLFNMEETEEQLIRSLFFCKTKEDIKEKCKTDILAYHYERYFNVFTNIEPYKQYIINALQGKSYVRTQIIEQIDHGYDALKEKIMSEFPLFFLNCIYEIDCLINEHVSFDSFIYYFMKRIFPDIGSKDDFDTVYSMDFDSGDEQEKDNEGICPKQVEDYIVKLDELLLECRIKNNVN